MKVKTWYVSPSGCRYYITEKYLLKGKTHYNATDESGERVVGLTLEDIKHWQVMTKEKTHE